MTFLASGLGAKRLELLRYFVPNATAIAMLVNPNYPATAAEVDDVRAAARSLGLRVNILNAWTRSEIDAAFVSLGRGASRCTFCRWSPFLLGQRDHLVPLSRNHTLPQSIHSVSMSTPGA